MNDDDQSNVAGAEDAVVPYYGDNDPCWQVGERYTNMPRAVELSGTGVQIHVLVTHIILAESSNPMAFRWLLNRLARSPANAPGSW
jgi:hypothetical protein